jgi:hypothetical protein
MLTTTIRISAETLQALRLEKVIRQKKSYDELLLSLVEEGK